MADARDPTPLRNAEWKLIVNMHSPMVRVSPNGRVRFNVAAATAIGYPDAFRIFEGDHPGKWAISPCPRTEPGARFLYRTESGALQGRWVRRDVRPEGLFNIIRIHPDLWQLEPDKENTP